MAKKPLYDRLFTPPKQSYFLFGPRGTGKSQFLKSHYPKAHIIDLLDERTLLSFSSKPELIEPIVKQMQNGDALIIDEVQKAPSLLAKSHQLMEDKSTPKIQFIFTGSSSRKLKTYGVDLLAGRSLLRTLHPFMAAEMGKDFNLAQSLELGLLPVVIGADQPNETLYTYIAIYLKEEVKQEGLVRNLESFSRFLEAMSFSHGEILNLSNVSRECHVKRSTLDGYLEILEDLLLGYRIPSFKKKNRKSTVESEKFYFFDCGVFKSLRPQGPLDNKEGINGPALEGLVLQHLRAWVSYRDLKEEIFFWRTTAGNEVDFVIYGPKTFWAIEVKNATSFNSKMISGLKSFHEDYPQAKCTLLHRGKFKEKHGNIECLPAEDFLRNLRI